MILNNLLKLITLLIFPSISVICLYIISEKLVDKNISYILAIISGMTVSATITNFQSFYRGLSFRSSSHLLADRFSNQMFEIIRDFTSRDKLAQYAFIIVIFIIIFLMTHFTLLALSIIFPSIQSVVDTISTSSKFVIFFLSIIFIIYITLISAYFFIKETNLFDEIKKIRKK